MVLCCGKSAKYGPNIDQSEKSFEDPPTGTLYVIHFVWAPITYLRCPNSLLCAIKSEGVEKLMFSFLSHKSNSGPGIGMASAWHTLSASSYFSSLPQAPDT
jgi:hypothetical protein